MSDSPYVRHEKRLAQFQAGLFTYITNVIFYITTVRTENDARYILLYKNEWITNVFLIEKVPGMKRICIRWVKVFLITKAYD